MVQRFLLTLRKEIRTPKKLKRPAFLLVPPTITPESTGSRGRSVENSKITEVNYATTFSDPMSNRLYIRARDNEHKLFLL